MSGPLKSRLLLILILAGCGDGSNTGAVKYYLERAATATTENHLRLEIQGGFRPKFSITGTGFTAEVPFDTLIEAQESTLLTADEFGEVSVDITLYQENQKAYLQDRLSWKSSPEVPPIPEPYFSEDASIDPWVYLVVPVASRGKNVKEVWVEGDLNPEVAAGSYYEIPGDDQVLLRLSEGDALKNLKVKYRNIFGTVGESMDMQIVRKSLPPTSCTATPVARITATGAVRTRIQAVNDGPMYFKVEGDVELLKEYRQFTATTDELIVLSAGEGSKKLIVKIRDAAGNFCDDIPLTIAYDRSYLPGAVHVQNNPLWTDNPHITIVPEFEHLDGDNISMYISGGVNASAETFQWIPYAESVVVDLSPTNGTRHVIVKFRQDETEMSEVSTPIFLKPYVLVSGSGAVVNVIPSDIIGAQSLTITGCVETYVQVAYAASYSCTKSTALATITYYLNDGTSVTRSVAF